MQQVVETLKIVLPKPIIAVLKVVRYLVLSYLGLRKKRPYPLGYAYQSRYMRHVPEHGIILDVGSGHNPFPKATILSDRFFERTTHRREDIVLDNRPFLILDIHHLPFKDKSLDYIYCSHVIEHTDTPDQVCNEFMRAGKAGYIETPTLMKDMLFSWAKEMGHKWYLVAFGRRLIFFEYDLRRQEGLHTLQWQRSILNQYYHPNQDIFFPNQDVFNTIFEWIGHFDVTVFRLAQSAPTELECSNRELPTTEVIR